MMRVLAASLAVSAAIPAGAVPAARTYTSPTLHADYSDPDLIRMGIDPRRVGVMGFSAGGELVSLIADKPEPADRPKTDAIDAPSASPDFQILIFPGPRGIPGSAITTAPPAFITAGSLDACCAAPAVALYE